MAKINISLEADLVVEAMVLAGVRTPQDAVELVVRDYIAKSHRTEERIETADRARTDVEAEPPQSQA
ncbi:type II toxin-antitoxin system VapB family antitoxin [Streptomyces sp. ACA25]|uniref:type II toxin-antitoxin system VapB family antitoxin n=1 Tax=Streptomyces sp. ACA25 TaxID=3022596 RepID=UPI002307A69F|nr:type II toxin-antitoxin system VapB family antitoxin [Streptomyces sp. ACA25]MDB1088282.1 type II toxin-antitoxin system VapB family antitoxin [Streptomyces sp. ACA25]